MLFYKMGFLPFEGARFFGRFDFQGIDCKTANYF